MYNVGIMVIVTNTTIEMREIAGTCYCSICQYRPLLTSRTLLTINTLMIEYEAGAASSAWAPKFALGFGGVRVAHLFNSLMTDLL
jgi:hypothetical protein